MEALKEVILENSPYSLVIGGLIIGFVFGFIVQRTNFCTMGSISDILSFGDYRRFRAWLLATAVAIIGAQALQYYGYVNLGQSMYLSNTMLWVGNVVGGFIFGVGMVYGGGCTSRNLIRVGGGDLRSLMVMMVVGLFAYMTIGGILGPLRADVSQFLSVDFNAAGFAGQGAGDLLAGSFGLSSGTGTLIATIAIAGALLVYCLTNRDFVTSPSNLIAGFGIGLCCIAGWALTGMAYDEFADNPQAVISLSYVRPTGDTLEYLRRYTANTIPGFGVATVFGAVLGAFLSSLMMGRFKIAGFNDTGDLVRNIFGGAAMGVGGVLALGCTIGQAVTGVSTLALGSILTFIAIVLGGVSGVKYLERQLMKSL